LQSLEPEQFRLGDQPDPEDSQRAVPTDVAWPTVNYVEVSSTLCHSSPPLVESKE